MAVLLLKMTTEEYYSREKIEKLLSLFNNEKVGRIGISGLIPDDEKPTFIHLIAFGNEKPNIINPIDGKIWNKTWEEKAKQEGIDYGTTHSSMFLKKIDEVDYSNVELNAGKMYGLLVQHNHAAYKYNKEIVEPFVNERKKLIEGCLIDKLFFKNKN